MTTIFLELTSALQQKRNWPLLKELWAAVVAKRRTNYNKTSESSEGRPRQDPRRVSDENTEVCFWNRFIGCSSMRPNLDMNPMSTSMWR